MATAFQPAWGFGTFSGCTPSGGPPGPASFFQAGMANNFSWPNVYTKMVETWTDSFGHSGTCTSIFSPYFDAPFSVTQSAGFNVATSGTYSSFTITGGGTIMSATFSGTAPFVGPYTGTYQAVLSAPPASWASLTAAANALLGQITLPTTPGAVDANYISGGIYRWLVVPIQASPGYLVTNDLNTQLEFDDSPITGAMCGMPALLATPSSHWNAYTSGLGGNVGIGTAQACICSTDYGNQSRPGTGWVYDNIGGCMSVKSAWMIKGQCGPNIGVPRTSPNQLQLYGQSYDPGTAAMGAISSAPNPFKLIATGLFPYTNPFGTNIPYFLTMTPSDVLAILNAGGGSFTNGILDFNSTAF